MELFASLACPLDKCVFDVHVHIFQRLVPDKDATFDFSQYLIKAADYGLGLILAYYILSGQHPCVGLASGYILPEKPFVEVNGRSETFHQLVCSFCESSAPGFFYIFAVSHGGNVF